MGEKCALRERGLNKCGVAMKKPPPHESPTNWKNPPKLLFVRPVTKPNTNRQHNNYPQGFPRKRHKTYNTLRPNSASMRRPEYKRWKQAQAQSNMHNASKQVQEVNEQLTTAKAQYQASIRNFHDQTAAHTLQSDQLQRELAKAQQEAEANKGKIAVVEQTTNSYPRSQPTTEEVWRAHAEGVLMSALTNLNLPPETWRSARLLRAVPNCRLVLTLPGVEH